MLDPSFWPEFMLSFFRICFVKSAAKYAFSPFAYKEP